MNTSILVFNEWVLVCNELVPESNGIVVSNEWVPVSNQINTSI